MSSEGRLGEIFVNIDGHIYPVDLSDEIQHGFGDCESPHDQSLLTEALREAIDTPNERYGLSDTCTPPASLTVEDHTMPSDLLPVHISPTSTHPRHANNNSTVQEIPIDYSNNNYQNSSWPRQSCLNTSYSGTGSSFQNNNYLFPPRVIKSHSDISDDESSSSTSSFTDCSIEDVRAVDLANKDVVSSDNHPSINRVYHTRDLNWEDARKYSNCDTRVLNWVDKQNNSTCDTRVLNLEDRQEYSNCDTRVFDWVDKQTNSTCDTRVLNLEDRQEYSNCDTRILSLEGDRKNSNCETHASDWKDRQPNSNCDARVFYWDADRQAYSHCETNVFDWEDKHSNCDTRVLNLIDRQTSSNCDTCALENGQHYSNFGNTPRRDIDKDKTTNYVPVSTSKDTFNHLDVNANCLSSYSNPGNDATSEAPKEWHRPTLDIDHASESNKYMYNDASNTHMDVAAPVDDAMKDSAEHHHACVHDTDNEKTDDIECQRRTTSYRRSGSKRQRGCKIWEYIRNLLLDPATNPSLIRWENQQLGTFRLIQPGTISRMWGMKKGNQDMNYEKLSRAMRYHYKKKVLAPVKGKNLIYRFGPTATGWKQPPPLTAIKY